MTTAATYSRAELTAGLRSVGIADGDVVFVHADLAALGMPAGCANDDAAHELVLGALREVVGAGGTILVPTYTFSFCRNEPFDVQETPTRGGPWSPSAGFLEYARRRPAVVRSADPIHSVAGEGPRAVELLSDLPHTCFGPGSVHARLREVGGKICMLGLDLDEATFRHHAEESVGLPYRYQKLFTGVVRDRGAERREGWLYYVRILADNAFPDGTRLAADARARGICRAAPVGGGEVLAVDAAPFFDLTVEAVRRDPWYTARGPAGDPVALERARVCAPVREVSLPARATPMEMIDALWRLPRDIVSSGYDDALRALGTQVPMRMHEIPTGSECWTWIVPERWTCHEAWLETMDGERLFSYAENPLHVVSYSLPFDGVVSRDELLAHLHVHPRLDDAVPFVFKYYERDWGLCCSRRLRDALHDARYRVVIRTSFSYDTLKVGEVVAPGATDETIVLCAHLCHPAMVNDDLSGVVVGIDVMRALLERHGRRYTYRLLILPETIGSVAFLGSNPEYAAHVAGGLFLEMLGRDNPHALQLSLAGDTEIDRCFAAALRARDPEGWTSPYRTLPGNDERQFNGPGVRVPMLQLLRVLPTDHAEHPYREYHSSEDTPDRVPAGSLETAREMVLAMIDTLERNVVPVNRYQGEVFCSRYGLHVDPFANPEGHRALFRIMDLIDGTRSVLDIADRCGIPFDAARGVVDELARHGLVGW